MAKNVSRLNYETVYDNIPYHVKERGVFPMTSANLSKDQIRFFMEFQSAISGIISETFEEEKESMKQLAEEMAGVCNQILKDN